MKLVLLNAVLCLVLSACGDGGCITKQETASAFSQRDRAIQVMAIAIKELQDQHPRPTSTPKGEEKK